VVVVWVVVECHQLIHLDFLLLFLRHLAMRQLLGLPAYLLPSLLALLILRG